MKGLFGGIFLGCGLLIAVLSGLCTGMLLLSAGFGGEDLALALPMALLFGGIPFGIGLGLFFLGRALIRQAGREKDDPAKDFE